MQLNNVENNIVNMLLMLVENLHKFLIKFLQ
jgi:hypothetical protein